MKESLKRIISILVRIALLPNEVIARVVSTFFKGILGVVIHFFIVGGIIIDVLWDGIESSAVQVVQGFEGVTGGLLENIFSILPYSVQEIVVITILFTPVYVILLLTYHAWQFYFRKKPRGGEE